MLIVSAATTPVEDPYNPDPGVVWVTVWVVCGEEQQAVLATSLDDMTSIPHMVITFTGTTWAATDVIVEERNGDTNQFKIRFQQGRKLA
jgi:hypothetical protein